MNKEKNKIYFSGEYPYPVTILMDRYGGTYSGGNFIAFNKYKENIPEEVGGSDPEEMNFWNDYKGLVGKGNTPDEATEDLKKMLNL